MKILIKIVALSLICSCGWNDSEPDRQKLNWDFFVISDSLNWKNQGYILAKKENESSFSWIAEDCVEIFYDSTNIYVKSKSYKAHFSYLQIKIKPVLNLNSLAEHKVFEMSKEEFDNVITNCLDCSVVDLKPF